MSAKDDVNKAVDAAVEAALSRVGAQLRRELLDAIVASLPEPPPPPPPPPAPVVSAFDVPALRGHLFELFDGTGQVEVLHRIMDTLGAYWHRTVLYLNKGVQFQPWDARGFDGGVGNATAKAHLVAATTDTILAVAITGTGAQRENAAIWSGIGQPSGSCAAVPLAIRNKAAAVVYCDGPKTDTATAVALLEVIARTTAASIELAMLTKRTEPYVRTTAVVAQPGEAAPAAVALKPEPMAWAVPIAEPAPPPVVARPARAPAPTIPAPAPAPAIPVLAPAAPSPAPAAPPRPAPAPAVAPAAVAAPAPVAAASPAAAAPEPAAGAVDLMKEMVKGGAKPVVEAGQQFQPAAGRVSRWKPVREQVKGGEVDESLAAIPEAERSKHVEAKKIARLLVSEIKLYNEAKVAVGRKNRDLYERLKEDIERSRANYIDRVGQDLSARTTYFRDELVATLAEGDAGALGKGV